MVSNLVYEKFLITCGLLYWSCNNPCLPYSLRITPAANVCFRQENLCGHTQVSNSSHTWSSLHKWLNCHHCCAGQNSDAPPDWGCFDLEAVQVTSLSGCSRLVNGQHDVTLTKIMHWCFMKAIQPLLFKNSASDMKIRELLRDILPTFHTLPQRITVQKPKNNTPKTKINKLKQSRVRFDATNVRHLSYTTYYYYYHYYYTWMQ